MLSGVFGLGQVVQCGHLRFIVIDATTVQAPGAKGTDYRLHVALDLVNLELRQIEVSTDKVGESLAHFQWQEGDVVLIDRGYNQPKTLVPFIDQGADVVLRYNPQGMSLYTQDERMERIDWVERLVTLQGQAGAIPVYLCHGHKRLEGVVHAIPLPAEQAAEARRRLRPTGRHCPGHWGTRIDRRRTRRMGPQSAPEFEDQSQPRAHCPMGQF